MTPSEWIQKPIPGNEDKREIVTDECMNAGVKFVKFSLQSQHSLAMTLCVKETACTAQFGHREILYTHTYNIKGQKIARAEGKKTPKLYCMVPKVFLSPFSLSCEQMNIIATLAPLTVSDAVVSGLRMRRAKVLQNSINSSSTPCHMSPNS